MPNPSQPVVISNKNLDIPAEVFVPPAPPNGTNPESSEVSGTTDTAMAPSTPNASGKRPALVVLHDYYGLDEATRRAANRLAGLGYLTLAPDLLARPGKPQDTSDELALVKFASALPDPLLINDTLAAVGWLLKQDEVDAARVGIIGWGWGGACALMAAAHDPRVRVAVDIGGPITYPVLTAEKPGSPLNFVANLEGALFAAYPGNDPLLPEGEVERLRGRLREHDKVGDVKIYPDAPPRFWRDESLPQTAQLWRSLTNFLQLNLVDFDSSEEPVGDYENEASRLHA